MDVQVKKEHYNFKKYVTIKRWNSYYYQLIEGMDENIKSILFIGIGDEIVPNVIKAKSKIKVDTFDFDEKLKPTIVGDVTKIDKVIKDKYDCIMCCQVLEHIPFENFEDTVKKLSKITNKKVILSLPCNYKTLVTCKVCAFRRTLRINIKIPRYWVKQYRKDIEGFKEHYWAIGLPYKKECKRKNIRKILNKYFEIEREFNPIENTYHIFYILKPKNK